MPVTADRPLVVLELRATDPLAPDAAKEAAYEQAAARLVEYARQLGLDIRTRRVERTSRTLGEAPRTSRRLIRFAIG